MLNYFVELLGTFFFVSIILTQKDAIPVGMALAVAIYFSGINAGYFNPAVTIMRMIDSSVSILDGSIYIIVQIIGALLALQFYKFGKK